MSNLLKVENGAPNVFPEPEATEWGQSENNTCFMGFTYKGISFRFRWIPPGEFMMGSPEDEIGRKDNETLHKVVISEGFWLGETAVTQELWEVVIGSNPSDFKKYNRPVDNVSWDDCQKFIDKLNQEIPELQLCLPTEAQWEYACRAKTQTPFYFGESVTLDEVNYHTTNPRKRDKNNPAREETVPVKTLPPNEWGLYEMHGNLIEWCNDWYGRYYIDDDVDPKGHTIGEQRVLRGGSWFSALESCRSAFRSWGPPDYAHKRLGFRLARYNSSSAKKTEIKVDTHWLAISKLRKNKRHRAMFEQVCLLYKQLLRETPEILYLFDDNPHDDLITYSEYNIHLVDFMRVCSLVYEFNTTMSSTSDIHVLSQLAGISIDEFTEYLKLAIRQKVIVEENNIGKIKSLRFANILAKFTLQTSEQASIISTFENVSESLQTSFSQRLSFLDKCDEAKDIAIKWITEVNLLLLKRYDDHRIKILSYCTFIAPDETLFAIEKTGKNDKKGEFFTRENEYFNEYVKILLYLAYDQKLSTKAIEMLILFSLSESPRENQYSIRDRVKKLFQIKNSNTMATREQRVNAIEKLLNSKDIAEVMFGLELLDSALKCRELRKDQRSFMSRDLEGRGISYWEVKNTWFNTFVHIVFEKIIDSSNKEIQNRAKFILANKFRELWIDGEYTDQLVDYTRKIVEKTSWFDGWVKIRSFIGFLQKKISESDLIRLKSIVTLLAPSTLIDEVIVYVLPRYNNVELGEEDSDFNWRYKKCFSLGLSIGDDFKSLDTIVEELLTHDGTFLFEFGKGLGTSCKDALGVWTYFEENLKKIDYEKREFEIVGGFIRAVYDKNSIIGENLLDASLTDDIMGKGFSTLQMSAKILNKKAIRRIKESIKIGVTSLKIYHKLALRDDAELMDDDFFKILKLLVKEGNDASTVILILYTIKRNNKSILRNEQIVLLLEQVFETLSVDFSNELDRQEIDYMLSELVTAYCESRQMTNVIKSFSKRFAESLEYKYSTGFHSIIISFIDIEPQAVLEGFLNNNHEVNKVVIDYFKVHETGSTNLFSHIPAETILSWCLEKPDTRYKDIVSVRPSWLKNRQSEIMEWTPLFKSIINIVDNPIDILNIVKEDFAPMTWGGALSYTYEKHIVLLEDLEKHDKNEIRLWAVEEKKTLLKAIKERREAEEKRG